MVDEEIHWLIGWLVVVVVSVVAVVVLVVLEKEKNTPYHRVFCCCFISARLLSLTDKETPIRCQLRP